MSDDRSLEGLRILGFCDYFTEDSSGGAEKVTAEVYTRLIEQGAEIRVVTTAPGTPGGEATPWGISTALAPGRDLSGLLRVQVTLAPRLLSIGSREIVGFRPDVLHASGLHFQSSLAAGILARRRNLPLATTGHIGSVESLPGLIRAATSTYERSIGRFILKSSSRVIAVSAAVADHMVTLGAAPGLVHVVPNGVDRDRFRPGSRIGKGVGVVFVGRLISNKGPDEVLEAFVGNPREDATLTFIGDGPMRGELEARVQHLGLQDRVAFTGYTDDVAGLLASADVMVRPSQTEGQSLAVLEAMASEVAVIASDIPPNRELIGDNERGLLVAPGDQAGLCEALGAMIGDEDRRVRLARAARELAVRHTWERCAEETGRVLAAAAGRKEAQ